MEKKIEMVCVGRRITTENKLVGYWLKLDAEGKHGGEDATISFKGGDPKGMIGKKPGAVFVFTQSEDGKWFTAGKKGPAFARRWHDESEIAGWEATDATLYAQLEAHKHAKKEMGEDALVRLLKPIAVAMNRSDSFGRAAMRLRVLAALDRAMGYR